VLCSDEHHVLFCLAMNSVIQDDMNVFFAQRVPAEVLKGATSAWLSELLTVWQSNIQSWKSR
jgi:hypothetical protein